MLLRVDRILNITDGFLFQSIIAILEGNLVYLKLVNLAAVDSQMPMAFMICSVLVWNLQTLW